MTVAYAGGEGSQRPGAKVRRRKPATDRIALRVVKGALVPADPFSAERLRQRGYRIGDEVSAELRKARNPKFNRMVHQLGQLLIQNVEAFAHYTDAHAVLKRLQIEGDIACEHVAILVPNLGMVEQRIPLSLSFETMDEGQFQEVYAAFCRHIAKTYWPELTPDQIQPMAELMGEAA